VLDIVSAAGVERSHVMTSRPYLRALLRAESRHREGGAGGGVGALDSMAQDFGGDSGLAGVDLASMLGGGGFMGDTHAMDTDSDTEGPGGGGGGAAGR